MMNRITVIAISLLLLSAPLLPRPQAAPLQAPRAAQPTSARTAAAPDE